MTTASSKVGPSAQHHRLELSVTGLACAGDAAPLAVRLKRLAGVLEALVNPVTERAVVRFDPSVTDLAKIFRVLEGGASGARDLLARWHAPAPGCMCAGCREQLKDTLGRLAGVEAVVRNPDEHSVTVEYVPSRSDEAALCRALTKRPASSCG
jgi:copper chaperone CopZ